VALTTRAASAALSRPRLPTAPSLLQWLALAAGLLAALPLIGVILVALSGPGSEIPLRDLLRYAGTSAWLSLLVGIATATLGSLAAWLVVMHRFPGRGFFSWALALPLAAPAFALAYAYADLFDAAGDLRMWMRASLGFDWPFEMRTISGAAFVLSFAFYPYVYLAMRAAFLSQSVAALESARMLGCSQREAFFRAALPIARPALGAGVALAVMETLADYGAVQFLAVQTLTTGVVRAWTVFGSAAGAARIALPLLVAAFILLWLERRSRRGRSHDVARVQWRSIPVQSLRGAKAAAATLYCLALLTAGLLLPIAWLLANSIGRTPELARLAAAATHSLSLAAAGALVTTILAAALALGAARSPVASRIASLGYATPGAVMAIGLLAPAALVWHVSEGLSAFWVGIGLLIYAYAARLMAAALEPIDAGLSRVTPSMIWAGRTLGRSEAGAALAVQLPVARGALLTAALIVFVDILKELPATLILRPFNFDTLAVIANNYALDERLGQAGWPSLAIIALALGPVAWLSHRIAASRPGEAR
jgi:iron(III) transport system permease protein